VLDNGQCLLTHTQLVTEVPPTIFNKDNSKIGSKFSVFWPLRVVVVVSVVVTHTGCHVVVFLVKALTK